MKKGIKLVCRYGVCLLSAFVLHLSLAPAYGGDASGQIKMDPRDIYLDMEGMNAVEGLPYEFMIVPEKYVDSTVDRRDIYLDVDVINGYEGLPYEFLNSPAEYVPIKHEQGDSGLDLDDMLSEDPSFVKGQEQY